MFRKAQPRLDRELAMTACPARLPVVTAKKNGDNKLLVTVTLSRPRWQRWLGGSDRMNRTFSLDGLGQEVYNACDGQTKVKAIVRAFAARHHLSTAEAEMSVTAFLKTMMAKGLVAMAVERNR